MHENLTKIWITSQRPHRWEELSKSINPLAQQENLNALKKPLFKAIDLIREQEQNLKSMIRIIFAT